MSTSPHTVVREEDKSASADALKPSVGLTDSGHCRRSSLERSSLVSEQAVLGQWRVTLTDEGVELLEELIVK